MPSSRNGQLLHRRNNAVKIPVAVQPVVVYVVHADKVLKVSGAYLPLDNVPAAQVFYPLSYKSTTAQTSCTTARH